MHVYDFKQTWPHMTLPIICPQWGYSDKAISMIICLFALYELVPVISHSIQPE